MLTLKGFLHRLNHKGLPKRTRFPLSSKIILVLAIFLSLHFVPQLIKAQEIPDPETDTVNYVHTAKDKGGNLEYTGGIMDLQTIVHTCDLLTGVCPDVVTAQKTGYVPQAPGGMLGYATNLTSKTFSPPASGIEYIASSFQQMVGGQPAYAQGVGFVGLQSILPVWKAFRNIVYLFSSLILIIIGLMVMLRIKISPQAVVTIQNALPKLVTTLLLVTFSYAIAGLLIDLSYFLQSAILVLLFNAQGRTLTQNLFTNGGSDPFTFSSLANADLRTIFNMSFALVPTVMLASLGTLLSSIVAALLAISVVGLPAAAAIAAAGPVLVMIIILVILLFWILKLFFGLVKCYATLIFKIIIGPLEIAMGAFPSAKLGFGTWMTDVLANLSVFPIVVLFMTIANIIVENAANGLWAPNLLRGSAIGEATAAFTNLSHGLVPVALGLGSLAILSKLPELVPQAIFMLKPSAWETAIGKSYEGVSGTAQKLGWGGVQAYSDSQSKYYEGLRDQQNKYGNVNPNEMRSAENQDRVLSFLASFSQRFKRR